MRFIDAYCHCGISKYNPLPVLEKVMTKGCIERAVIVQHLGEFDNSYIQSIVAGAPQKFAGVCLVDWDSEDAARQLVQWSETGFFRGVRLSIESLESNRPLWSKAAEIGLNIAVYSFENMITKIDLLKWFLDEYPGAVVIVTHLGFPDLEKDPQLKTHSRIFEMADYEGVYFQVSGMHMFCDYPYRPLWQMMEKALKYFGPDRMLWGSNYPVIGEDDLYIRETELMQTGEDRMPCSGLEKISAETALKVWF